MKKYENSTVFNFIVIIILTLFMGFIIFLKVDNSTYKSRDERSLEELSRAWHTDDNEIISLEDIGKQAVKNDKGELEISVYHTIPAYLTNDTFINLRARNVKFRVFVDNELVYSFMPDKQLGISRGNGSSFHRINIDMESAGKQLRFDVFPVYNDGGSLINKIYLGRTWDYSGMILDQNFLGFQISVFTAIVGIILIIMSFAYRRDDGQSEKQRTLGILILCVGVWSVCETLVIQLLFGYSFQLNEINYLLLIFMPYFFISYIYQTLEYSSDFLLKVSFGITILELVVINVFNVMGIMDLHDLLFLVHICFSIIALISAVAVAQNISYCKKNGLKYDVVTILLTMGVFIICAAGDLINYYFGYGLTDDGFFMKFGIVIGALILTIDSVIKFFDGIKKAEVAEKMKKAAYTDNLTGMPNRAAFEAKEKEIQEKIDNGEIKELLICQFDLNDLKKVNDNYGHAQGDRHIIKCAEIINKAFGKSGFAFRIGGDEFLVFVIGDGAEYIYERGILELKELEREYNRLRDATVPLHMAYGHVVYKGDEFESLEKAEMEADKRMYELKERMKKGAIA